MLSSFSRSKQAEAPVAAELPLVLIETILMPRKSKRKGGTDRRTKARSGDFSDDEEDEGSVALMTKRIRHAITAGINKFNDVVNVEGGKTLYQYLLEMDTQKTGHLSGKHLRKFLSNMHFDLDEESENLLVEVFLCTDSTDVGTGKSAILSGGGISVEDLVIHLIQYSNTRENDTLDVANLCHEVFLTKKITPKEIARVCRKFDPSARGMMDSANFETMLKKLLNGKAKEQVVSDLERFMDPDRDNELDYGLLVSLTTLIADAGRIENKLKRCCRLMRLRGINYKKAILEQCSDQNANAGDEDDGGNQKKKKKDKKKDDKPVAVMSQDEFVDLMLSFQLPVLEAEYLLLTNKFKKHNDNVDVTMFLETMEEDEGGKATKEAPASAEVNETFSKSLFNKLCKLRSNAKKLLSFRTEVLKCDEHKEGYCQKRAMQRVIDTHMDLTDAECSLLLENFTVIGGMDGHKHKETEGVSPLQIDYPLLLLLLHEPINNPNLVNIGLTIVIKLMNNELRALNKLVRDVFSTLSDQDNGPEGGSDDEASRGDEESVNKNSNWITGMSSQAVTQEAFKDECVLVDQHDLLALLDAFKSSISKSAYIYYPEMLSFLKCCSAKAMMHRVHVMDLQRQKQGYRFGDHLISYAQKEGKKMDKGKLIAQFLTIGIILPQSAFDQLCITYANSKTKLLDVPAMVDGMWEGNPQAPAAVLPDGTPAKKRVRRQVSRVSSNQMTCELDDIDTEILKDYDQQVVACAQRVFDIFDDGNINEVPAAELERMLSSLGVRYYIDEVEDLLEAIDRRRTGIMYYDSYIAAIIPYLRSKYKSVRGSSKMWLKRFFESLDLNGDKILSRSEFQHIVATLRKVGVAPLTDEECSALMSYLDEDNSDSVDWAELDTVFDLLDDVGSLNDLPEPVCYAIHKLQFVSLPKPDKFLTMFNGMPSVTRVSVLAQDIAPLPEHSLEEVLCGNKNTTTVELLKSSEVSQVATAGGGKVPPHQSLVNEWELQFEVQIGKITGVPAELPKRTKDVIERGVRFCLCRTSNPATAENPGSPPQFLGNVVKLHASIQEGKLDRWIFNSTDNLDPDTSCFVRCHSSDVDALFADDEHAPPPQTAGGTGTKKAAGINLSGTHTATKGAAAAAAATGSKPIYLQPIEQIHLFVELVTTIRVRKDRPRKGSKQRKRGGVHAHAHGSGHGSSGESSEEDSADGRSRGGGRNGGGAFDRDRDRAKDRRTEGRNSFKQQGGAGGKDDRNGKLLSTQSTMSSFFGSTSGSTSTGGVGAQKAHIIGHNSQNDPDTSDDDDDDEFVVAELTSGWAMIPLAAAILQSPSSQAALARAGVKVSTGMGKLIPAALSTAPPIQYPLKTLEVPMYGGSAFSLVTIDAEEVDATTQQNDYWLGIRRAIGFGVKSIMTVVLRRLPTLQECNANALAASGGAANDAKRGLFSGGSPTATATATGSFPVISTFTKLTGFLPNFLAAPTSGVAMIGIYRQLLLQATLLPFSTNDNSPSATSNTDTGMSTPISAVVNAVPGSGPGSGNLASSLTTPLNQSVISRGNAALLLPNANSIADPVFSNFPRLIADPAASQVMFYLWSKEMPAAVKGNTYKDCAMSSVLDASVQALFKDIVLRVWYAFSSPTAQKCRLNAIESLEDTEQRVRYLQLVMGVVAATAPGITVNGHGHGGAKLNATVGQPGVGAKLPKGKNALNSTATGARNASAASTGMSAGVGAEALLVHGDQQELLSEKDILHTPFHTKELMWNRSQYL